MKTILSYCLKCRKKGDCKNLKIVKTNEGKLMNLSKCAMYYRKKSIFIKALEASELLSGLALKTLLGKIPLVSPILF